MEKDILHEGGTTELEILEFRAGGNSYGIGVNEIREILSYDNTTTPVPNSHPFIEGIIIPRDFIITIINFKKSFQLSDVDENSNEMLIVTRLDDLNIAIHVDSVSGIHRIVESDITQPEVDTVYSDFISGVITSDERRIEIVNFKKFFQSINPNLSVA